MWGVTEEFFKEHMFPDTPDSVLTTLGSMSCLVSYPHLLLIFV